MDAFARNGILRTFLLVALIGACTEGTLGALDDSDAPSSRDTAGGGDAATNADAGADGATSPDALGPIDDCPPLERFFENEVWAKVAEPTCVNCHIAAGPAANTALVLRTRVLDPDYLAHNQAAFEALAAQPSEGHGGLSRLLVKVSGGLEHGGGAVVAPGTRAYEILESFVARVADPEHCDPTTEPPYEQPEFFDAVTMISDQRLLRRLTLSLGARLPSAEEIAQVELGGLGAIETVLDGLMKEQAFFTRLKEGFNDIILTEGYDGPSELVLSWEHFRATRGWPAGMPYEVFATYRDVIRSEPLELIAHIVREERPFTEFATADYIVVSPYTARGYNVFDQVKDSFDDPQDPYEFIPFRLPSLTDSITGEVLQESPTGFYPHAGLLTTFHFTHRYPNTDTNRNRLRSNTVFQIFLGTNLLDAIPAVSDAAATSTQFDNPTMQAPDCVVCHKRLDPLAGLYQDYNNVGDFRVPRDGWYTDMFVPGFDGEDLPTDEKWRALQWLGERIAGDPRFPITMVEHVYQILFGRKVLVAPQDVNSALFDAQRRAYLVQRAMIEQVAARFVTANYNLKDVFKALAVSPFYRAGAIEGPIVDPRRRAELDDLGGSKLLTPEQLDRQLKAIFGRTFRPLLMDFTILYGGINSSQITARLSEPSGSMGAIQRVIANDIVCDLAQEEFNKPVELRLLFAKIEPSVRPDGSAADRALIRQTIVDLQQRLLGRNLSLDDPEVERTYALFDDVVTEGQRLIAAGEAHDRVSYMCGGQQPYRNPADPHFTIRGWRAVMTYMIRQHDFLYQ
ncbi:MAG: DUF1588 domain-containing protein [Bradymonadaceae bacterium]|nr:DUF1588 domain-containing protein [Lujinxingiaceae bacterium]